MPSVRVTMAVRSGREEGAMSAATKTMTALTFGALVVTSAYTVALGSNGWLWFGWVVLGMLTIGTAAADT